MLNRRLHAAAGALGAGLALAVPELVAGLSTAAPSLVEEVGDVVIDNVPTAVKDWAIATFGTADKPVLIAGIVLVTIGLGALVGMASRSRRWLAPVVFVAFGGLGTAAALVQGTAPAPAVATGAAATVSGLVAYEWMRRRADRATPATGDSYESDTGRRAFLTGAGAIIVLAAVGAGTGRILVDRTRRMISGRESVVLPTAAATVPPPPETATLAVRGITPLITPNSSFYRIDTALTIPQVDLETWRLRIHGMVERPFELTFDQLLAMDPVEAYVTLSCVSNQVGGSLVGNALWLGVPLSRLLDRAGVGDGATQVVGRSVDNFTVGFPTEAAYDGREAMVAFGMNGEPLPFDHGFPARLVVSGLYGYVSATKWLSDIELTTWDGFDAYWVPRGWSKRGPVKLQSRIDTPRRGARIGLEERVIAGVAWAPNIGIERVEVQVDEGEWVEAELSSPLNDDTWRQWALEWAPTEGQHVISVRATDRNGTTQTSETAPPAPDGATGWHTIQVHAQA